ncbi:MAG: undecaprenyldiphospho-muramoylpentapeptide beta-N-acetylglucosaminyltransferase [Caldimicrobium sp.]
MKWVITAGGTGGHLIPGIALAQEIMRLGEELIFISGTRPVEKHILRDKPFRVYQLEVEGIVGRPLKDKIRAGFKLIKAIHRVRKILAEYKPHAIIAEGGYVSVPVVVAGKLLGIKTALHEQNVIPGKANLLLSKMVDKVFISFPESKKYFPEEKVVFSGNPVRRELLLPRERDQKGIGLLVMGGSLGARFLNDLILKLFPKLFEVFPELFLIHQTGLEDFERVKEEYEKSSHFLRFKERIKIFPFIEDMGWAYNEADLVIARAGATTIAELIALKKPAILIPYPYAAGRHQDINAEVLARIGGAIKFNQKDLEEEKFLEVLKNLLSSKETLEKMKRAYETLKVENPSGVILSEMRKLVEGTKNA